MFPIFSLNFAMSELTFHHKPAKAKIVTASGIQFSIFPSKSTLDITNSSIVQYTFVEVKFYNKLQTTNRLIIIC